MSAGAVAARVRNLTKTYGAGETRVVALDDVSIDLAAGEFTAVMGPSGSGKSTLMHCLAALDTADSGSVMVGDQELTLLKDKALTRLRRDEIGFVFQSYNLVPTLTSLENVMLAGQYAGVLRGRARSEAMEALGWVGLAERHHHRPMEMSGGEQQRVAIARALVNRPKLLLGDEPTGNLDSQRSAEVLQMLRRFNRERGQTVLMVTHDADVGAACDRVIHMRDGRCERSVVNQAPASA
jgi:putative ABC transport system ATP-binding protein